MSRTFSIKTLGCKLNQYESALIAQRFLNEGWHAIKFGNKADVIIINTCTVTDKSDKKCRNLIRQGARFSKTGKVIVTGCMVETAQDVLAQMPEVEAYIPNSKKEEIFDFVVNSEKVFERTISKNTPLFPMPFERTRGFVKIQDGCNQCCSYCVVPFVRGNPKSRPVNEVIAHVRALIENSCPEIVLTGITIGNYYDSNFSLSQIVKAIVDLDGNFRLRITSIEPQHVTDELIEVFQHPKICKHLHLPLQSGSDKVLRAMNRPYSKSEYLKIIEKIKLRVPAIALGTDIIVGFPTENDSDFAETIDVVQYAQFSYVHQFTFSPRSHTPAASYLPLPVEIVRKRSEILREVAKEISLLYRKKFLGSILPCIIEKKKHGETFIALSENYIKIEIPANECARAHTGKIVPVMLKEVSEEGNRGVIAIDQ